MSIRIMPLRDEHLEDAATLVTARYRDERKYTPFLPARYGETSAILPPLRDLARKAPGVAAIRGGRLAGFLIGQMIGMLRGRRCAYSPEWAHAADVEEGREIYREMYAHLAASWVANGCSGHLVTVLAHDQEALEACRWSGFALTAVDALRDLAPLQASNREIEIRRAGPGDVEVVTALGQELQRHVAAAPIFFPLLERRGRGYHEQWLANPSALLWLACVKGEALAYMRHGPINPGTALITQEEKTTSISGAFTKEKARGKGIGTALLSHVLDWARSAALQRCAVDFEPENVLGARFWLKHFKPVCYSLIRYVDERIFWANERRADRDMW